MPMIQWGRGTGERTLGQYTWNRANGYVCYVDPEDALEVLTNRDFRVVDVDDLTTLEGVDEGVEGSINVFGVFTFSEMVGVDASALAHELSIEKDQVERWTETAKGLAHDPPRGFVVG